MGNLVQFPRPHDDSRGTVHVMPGNTGGFEIGHESASGGSWGSFSTYPNAQEAITAAYALNRDVYQGTCNVSICDAALNSAISTEDF
ncbi:hypothetical protein [Sphingomonas sp. GB1N7]|uniref:hypothetical protein n=1 Tax=Parasphingomonas caseinilytica TaxID=3096158 RepID=UPI002FC7A2FE